MMRTTLMAVTLAASLLAGCGGGKGGKIQKFTDEDLATNPAANFQKGLQTLQNPDKKTGAVDYNEAFNRFNASANLGGGAKAHFNAGWVAEKMGDPTKAAEHYRLAYEADASYDAALFSLARVLNESGKAGEAVALYESVAQRDPKNYDARNDLIAAYIRAGSYDKAFTEAQEILRFDPQNSGVFRNLSAMYYAQGNYGMSQLMAEKSLELNDGDPGTYNNMGVTYLIQGDEPQAIEKFKTAVKLDSENYPANMNLGYVALNSGDYQLADTAFTGALATQPGSIDAKLGKAVALRGLEDHKGSGTLYDDIIEQDPQNEAAYFNAATLHERYTKDFGKALKYLQAFIDAKAGTISPTHDVFARMERVKQAKAEEDARIEAEKQRKREEAEREKRNKELLANLASVITTYQGKMSSNASCIDPMLVEEVGMVLEQAQMVVDAEEVSMAADVQTLLDGYTPLVDEAVDNCAAGGGAAPAEEAPAEGVDGTDGEPPTEEAPAEEGGE
mgnify:CR=1 FL=1